MKRLCTFIPFLLSIVLFSCGGENKISSAEKSAVYGYPDPDPIKQSLFDSRDRTISEENIQKLLAGKLELPDTVRIALYQYTKAPLNRYYYGYATDEDFLKNQQSFVDTLVSMISKSKRVRKIVLIPNLMISSTPNITSMRETAVRLQADLLLVFAITSDLYYKFRVFNKDEAKAFATTECMLMDIRTSMVPFSSIVTRDAYSKKINKDENTDELRKRTERTAIMETLSETGNKIVAYMR
jgi:hypothetical protein